MDMNDVYTFVLAGNLATDAVLVRSRSPEWTWFAVEAGSPC